MSVNVIHPDLETMEHSRVKWGAIIAGVLLAMAVQVALGLFGLAIGLSALNPATNNNFSEIGIGTGIWLFLSTLISLFLGSVIASWFGVTHHRDSSMLHGILVWGLFLLLSLSMLGSGVRGIAGGAFSLVSAGLTGVSQGAATQGTDTMAQQFGSAVSSPNIQQNITGMAAQSGPASRTLANLSMPASARTQMMQRMAADDTQGAAAIVSRNTGMSQAQALSLVQRSQQENMAAARQTAQRATDTAGRAAWLAFFAILLSLIVSAFGGLLGGRVNRSLADSYEYIER